MAYIVYKSDGTLFLTLDDGQLNTSDTSITLLGKNVINYGQYQNSNIIHMLENFSKTSPPANPLTGQIWFDKTLSSLRLNVYNGTSWKSVPNLTISSSAPSINPGDLWWNPDAQELSVQSTSTMVSIGGKDSIAPAAAKLAISRKINGVDFDGTSDITITSSLPNSLTFGTYLTGGEFSGNSPITTDVDVGTVNQPTPSKVVARDSNGDVWFQVGHGTATASKYADLAEKYKADRTYDVGTVVVIGGKEEVTECSDGDRAIGVVSGNPGFMMNTELVNGTYIALKGRVPVKIYGDVKKSDKLVAGPSGRAIRSLDHTSTVFAIALEDSNGKDIIEALVL